jgi:Tfp pilus assembly protein PilO
MRSALEKKTFLSIAAFTGCTFLIIGFVIIPTVRYILQLDKQTDAIRLLLEKKNERAINFRSTIKQIEKIKNEAPDFSSHFFIGGQELKLITTLENLANKNNISQRIDNSNIDSTGKQQILITLTISGDYEKVLTYLGDLEKLPYFITVSRLNIAPIVDRNNPTNTNQVSMNLSIRLYVTAP